MNYRPQPKNSVVTWSPALLVVGFVLQIVFVFLMVALVLLVRPLTMAGYASIGAVVDTIIWMESIGAFLAALISLFIVRKRPTDLGMLLLHVLLPAATVAVLNFLSTLPARSWISVLVGIVMMVAAAAAGGLIYATTFGRRRGA